MSEWHDYTLGEYAKVLGGYAFKSGEFDDTGDFPVIKIKNIASGKLDMTGCQYISREVAGTALRFRAKRSDILIALTGSHIHQPSSMVGKVARYSTDDVAYINQRVGKVYSKNVDKLNEDFLYYFLKCDETTYGLALSAGGSANQANISAGQIESLQISLPSIEEQREIAEILLSLDDKIDLLTRQNATLEALAQTYFRQVFCEGEQTVRLGDYFPVKTGKQDANIATEDGKYLFFTCSKEPLRTDNYSFNEPSILLAGNGDFNVKWYRDKFEAYQRTYVLSPYDQTDLPWLYFAMSYYLNDITNGHRGSVINFITKGMIEEFTIKLPTVTVFNGFKQLASNIIEKQESNYKQILTLQILRGTLLPKIISGEVRI